MTASSRTLRVLLFQEGRGSLWVAQCLEIDIVAHGASIQEALDDFRDVFNAQIAFDLQRNRRPFALKKQAPPWYWQALKEAKCLEERIPVKMPAHSWWDSLLSIFSPSVVMPFVRG